MAALLLALYLTRSPIGIAVAVAVISPLGAFVNAYPNKKLLNYGYLEQMRDILPSFTLSVAMGIGVYVLSKIIIMPTILLLAVLTMLGMLFYLLSAKLLKLECFEYILQTMKDFFNRKKNHNL